MDGISIKVFLDAAIGGVLPTFLFLWFWLVAEDDHHHPPFLFILTYIGGMLGVLALLPLKPHVQAMNLNTNQITILYAALEEITKFAIVALIAFSYVTVTEPTDYTIYLITGALGFSALENTLYWFIDRNRQLAVFRCYCFTHDVGCNRRHHAWPCIFIGVVLEDYPHHHRACPCDIIACRI
jgi:RsiW-degrading membrane proteinase PrsW (M82 family)